MSGRLRGAPRSPHCDAVTDGWTAVVESQRPDKGAVTVCFYCLKVSVFDGEPLALRPPRPNELEAIKADSGVNRVILAIYYSKLETRSQGATKPRR